MVDQDDGATAESRPPTLNDLLALCRELNKRNAKYIVIGGMAMIQAAVRKALEILPDKAVTEVQKGDLERYVVVRVADEIVVDLQLSASGIHFAEAQPEADVVNVADVPIPFASRRLLLRMKQTGSEKDTLDLLFLRELLSQSGSG